MTTNNKSTSPQLISYFLLRKIIGLLGIILPISLVLGSYFYGDCKTIQGSISDYYHTDMRNIFVGVLCAVALFMFTYKGYDIRDSIAGNLACLFALGVAFFPTSVSIGSGSCAIDCLAYEPWVSTIHFTFAGLFFSVLIYFSLFLFTQSKHKNKADRSLAKQKRNFVFRCCAYIMIACILLIIIYEAFLISRFPILKEFHLIFWLESIALLAFGVSWLTKGQFVFKDE